MDKIRRGFLTRQHEEGMKLAADSDVVELLPSGGPPPDRYIVRFHCRGLVRAPGGEIETAEEFRLGIWFPDDYLDVANPFEVITWFAPRNVFHPNIGPGLLGQLLICPGHLQPGTSLVGIVEQCFEIITYQKMSLSEKDALRPELCAWARENQHRFPVDSRPLRRRTIDFDVEPVTVGSSA